MTVTLDPDSSSEAGVPSQFVLELQVSSDDRSELLAGLRRVLTYGRVDEQPRLHL